MLLADELFGLLRSSLLPGDAPSRSTPSRESPVADKGKRPMEEDVPSEASSPGEVEAAPAAGTSFRVPALLASGEDPAEAPRSPPARTGPARDPLEEFKVPPTGAPFGAGSHAHRGASPGCPSSGLCWTRSSRRRALSSSPRNRSRQAIVKACGC